MKQPKFFAIFCVILLKWAGCVQGQNSKMFVSNATDLIFIQNEQTSRSVYSNRPDGRIVGIAVDIANNRIFWSDISFISRGIYSADIASDHSLENVKRIYHDVGEVNSISVDWVHSRIYWTDSYYRSIEVSDYEGNVRYVLDIDRLGTPRGIFADPVSGYLFWNDQSEKVIERSKLDGSGREIIVDSGLTWPNQISVKNQKLYCVDGSSSEIMSYNLDGTNPETLGNFASLGGNKSSPGFGLILGSNYAYVSVWYTGKVVAVPLEGHNRKNTYVQNLGSDELFSLAGLEASLQPSSSDACSGRTCTNGMCLPQATNNGRCVCQNFGKGGPKSLTTQNTCIDPENLLFYVMTTEGIVAAKDTSVNNGERLIVGRSTRPVAVAYDPVEQYVYWSDVHQRSVHRSKLDGTEHTIILSSASHALGIVDGMAIDPKNRKLYYTNMGTIDVEMFAHSWHKIEFVTLDGNYARKTIVETASKPRGLHVDYQNGYLYYTDWGTQPSVVRVNLDGSGTSVVRIGDLDNPNGVTVHNNKIYIIDSHNKTNDQYYPVSGKTGALYSVSTNGFTGWTEELNVGIHTPFAITSDGTRLYISDWGTESIIQWTPGGTSTTFISDIELPTGLYFSPRTMSEMSGVCNGRCSEFALCVDVRNTANCECNSYTSEFDDASTCTTPVNYIVFADFNSLKAISLENNDEYQVVVTGNSYLSNYVALAFDEANNGLYFSDVSRQKLLYTQLGSNNTEELKSDVNGIDGLALHNNKLYWTDYSEGTVKRMDLTNKFVDTIVSDLDKPRDVKVTNEYIYWTEWGERKRVARTLLNSPGNVLLVKDGLTAPNGIDIDLDDHLYIADSSDDPRILECELDGNNCVELEIAGEKPKHIFSIKKDANRIFYTDWIAGTLSMLHLDTHRIVHYAENLMRPTGIVVKSGTLTACPSNHGCSVSCQPVPGGYFCSCPAGQYLDSDEKTCLSPTYASCTECSSACSANQVCSKLQGDAQCSCVCKPGYTGPSCSPCSTGQFKQEAGSASCESCPSDSSSSETGSIQCTCTDSNKAWDWITKTCKTSKTGECPAVDIRICSQHDDCSKDSDCSGGSKCCNSVACGGNKCTDPKLPIGSNQCVYQGSFYEVAEMFNVGNCVNCECKQDKIFGNPLYGYAHCDVTFCPKLECPESEQRVPQGDCCPVCRVDCSETPITIQGCESGELEESKELQAGGTTVSKSFANELGAIDNCAEVGRVLSPVIIEPDLESFTWKEQPHTLTATVKVTENGNVVNTAECNIRFTVLDNMAPTVTCPPSASSFQQQDCPFTEPEYEDNVCGNADCLVERVTPTGCTNLSPGTYTVKYKVADRAGNEAPECEYIHTVEANPLQCSVPTIDNGEMDCTDGGECTLICNSGYSTDLLESDNTIFTCQGSSFSPPLPLNMRERACARTEPLQIIGSIIAKLPCPVYDLDIIRVGVQGVIERDYVSDNPGMTVNVSVSECKSNDQIELVIELRQEYSVQDFENKRSRMQEILERINSEIVDGNLFEKLSPPEEIPETIPAAKDCLPGQIKTKDDLKCVSCSKGYKEEAGECNPCDRNTYNDRRGNTYCYACSKSFITKSPGATDENQCVERSEPNASSLPIIIGVIVAVAVVIIVLIIVVIVVYRCRKKSPGEKYNSNASYGNPTFQSDKPNMETDVYDELKMPEESGGYSGLDVISRQNKTNEYDNLGTFTKGPEDAA